MSIFDDARSRISRGLIETLAPGGEWRGTDYWICSPIRSDAKPGSFHISEDGLYYDHATDEGGDLIRLVEQVRHCSTREAAEWIVTSSGGVVPERKRGRPARVEAKMPIPVDSSSGLNAVVRSSKRGTPAGGWRYHDAEGGWVFAVVRYNAPDGTKQVVPYHLGTDGTWREGMPIASGRPLYRLHELVRSELPVLVVEGEKCADVPVSGWIVTTWSSGASSVGKTDFSPLAVLADAGRRVVVWPDADEPGAKAARAILERVPTAEVLDVQGRAAGWDIADALTEGLDPAEFIETCPRIQRTAETPELPAENDAGPFIALGSDNERHYFLRTGERIPYAINRGAFNASKILGLAPLRYWQKHRMTNDAEGIKVALAQDHLQKLAENAGRYNPDRLRGAGVWREGDSIVVNDGRRIVPLDGSPVEFDKFSSKAVYIASDAVFGNLDGDASTDEEGQQLLELFEAQAFTKPVSAMLAAGWCLISPYAGVLDWRPHMWMSGRRGTGKSWVLDNLMHPLLGPFAYRGSGKDSEAGIRRSLQNDARPVVLDEMEPLDRRAMDRATAILQLARNASSDASEYMTIAGPDGGTLRYRVRSCFCFASVQVPDSNAAIESRIVKIELANVVDQRGKIARSTALMPVMAEPERFLRRTFHALPRLLKDIRFVREKLMGVAGDVRQIDTLAPLIAAAWSAISDETISGDLGVEWLHRWLQDLREVSEEIVEDEDRVIQMVLGHQILNDDRRGRTVAELLKLAISLDSGLSLEAKKLLARFGIALPVVGSKRTLAIATSAKPIMQALTGTPYETGYDAQFRRHRTCVNPTGNGHNVMLAGKVTRCRLLDWEQFEATYLVGVECEDDSAARA